MGLNTYIRLTPNQSFLVPSSQYFFSLRTALFQTGNRTFILGCARHGSENVPSTFTEHYTSSIKAVLFSYIVVVMKMNQKDHHT